MPWGNMNIPPPKLLTSLPDASNLRMVGRFDPTQVFAPHLSATQMDLPSGSISTALVAPHALSSGIFAQFSTVAYGLGRSLTGWTLPWVYAPPANIASAATIAGASMNLTRHECDITIPPLMLCRSPAPNHRAQWPCPYLFAPPGDGAPKRPSRQGRQGSAPASANAWRRPEARR